MQLNKPRTEQGPHGVFTAKHAIYEKGKETQLEKELGAVAASAPTYRSYCALNARFLYGTRTVPTANQTQKWPRSSKESQRGYAFLARTTPTCKGKVYMMVTDAPTTSRHSIMLALLQVSLRWMISAEDIRAAFLNGIPAPRDFYFRQSKLA